LETDSEPVTPLTRPLAVSVVSYNPCLPEIQTTLESLADAVEFARARGALETAELLIVDNGPGTGWKVALQKLLNDLERKEQFISTRLLSGHGNVGYGAGHNLAINQSSADFNLVLNPDVVLDRDAILKAMHFMYASPEVGLITPFVANSDGSPQFLCKRYPTVLDLVLRGFAPQGIQRMFRKRLESYEMRDVCGNNHPVLDVPIVSGCFMLFRRNLWEKVGGFSKKYFMYFEDFDLSLRFAEVSRLAYVPSVRIRHFGGNAAHKGKRHILMFIRSALTFFYVHGWKLW